MQARWAFYVIISFLGINTFAQDVILNSNKPIRAFKVVNDTIYYSNNDHIIIFNNEKSINKIYMGGYVLDIMVNFPKVTSMSNKYKEDIGTIRIFDLNKNAYSLVYKIEDKSPMISYHMFPFKEDATAVLVAFNSGNLKWFDGNGRLINNLGNFSKVRRIRKFNNNIFFCTDIGEIYKTDGKYSKVLFNSEFRIMDFIVDANNIYAINELGNLISFDFETEKFKSYIISSNILMSLIKLNNETLVLGDWEGKLFIFDTNKNKIKSEINAHDKMILNLQAHDPYKFYSSSQDGTLRSWNIKTL